MKEYKIELNDNKTGELGKVLKEEDDSVVAVIKSEPKEDDDTVIWIPENKLELKESHPNIFEFIVYHELAHILYEDKKNQTMTDDKLEKYRIDCIRQNKVLPATTKADAFVLSQMGKSKTINALDYLAVFEKTAGSNIWRLNVQEYELRKKLVKKL